VIQRCTSLSKKYNIAEFIKEANMGLIELAKDPSTTPDQFQLAANKLNSETGYNVWCRMSQVRGCNDVVKL